MKILITGSKEYPMGTSTDKISSGGIEIYVEGLVNALHKHTDHDIIVLTRQFKNTQKKVKKDRISVFRVPYLGGFYLRNPTFNILAFLKSITVDHDLIIANGEISSILMLITAKIRRKPIAVVCHGDASVQPQYNGLIKCMFKTINKIVYRYSDIVIAHKAEQVSNYTDDYRIILPGIDTHKLKSLSLNKELRLKQHHNITDQKVVVYIGRMIDTKGVADIVDSAISLNSKDIVFVFIGDGPHLQKYKDQYNKSKKQSSKCIFTGHVDNIADYLSIADLYVLPSKSEGLSYSTIEAGYMRVPILTTKGVIPDDCGWFVPFNDAFSISVMIQNILYGNINQRQKINNAYTYALQFDWDIAIIKYMQVLSSHLR